MAQNRNLFRLTRFILLKLPYLFRFLALVRKTPGKRLLIIKADAIGDYILFRNFIEQVKKTAKYKDHEIELLGNTAWESLAMVYDSKDLANSYFISPNKIAYEPLAIIKLGWALFKRNYAVVLNPSSTRTFIADGFAGLTSARQIIGFESDFEGMPKKYKVKTDKFYTTKLLLPAGVYHEFHRNNFYFSTVLHQTIALPKPVIPFESKARTGIMIFPGAGLKKRGWEPEKFANLIKLIRQQTTAAIYIAGGPDETSVNQLICHMAASDNVIDITGKTTLPQLIEQVAVSSLVIANDSSAIHMAVSVDTPSVCITGGGHFNRFVPYPAGIAGGPACVYQKMDCYYCNWICIYQTQPQERFPCISIVTVDMAWQVMQPLLRP
ncbi:glycosyltransferase family 9 protein [Mucilaginibacter sp. ZT4R22]|uniref:Glycosyltransferase family 9 protein n=1 Tax=Mucilaginibacter pankratovii TaxID=2772110 RepID=A0ABR7WR44_9SPHI|nr:glycosyltransferase family 9 protein [Mucilaginibacter pankratovii]MBD1364780.1 glycosyltransferase family 9 protein [Mucilaginibacter pankratovii]